MSSPSFSYSSPFEAMLTGGTESYSPRASALVSMGMRSDAGPAPVSANAAETVRTPPPGQTSLDGIAPGIVLDGYGNVVPVSSAFNPSGSALQVSRRGNPDPSFDPAIAAGLQSHPETSYTGSDLKVLIEVANPTGGNKIRLSKRLAELTTITVSIHRSKSPVPAMGYINTKGWARGRRTIAGTMVLTKFTKEALYDFLIPEAYSFDLSKDSVYSKVDQLPPFNLTLLFSDEFGRASFQRILGVEFCTTGDVFSIQDMLSEQTVSYVAADFTPLLPYSHTVLNDASPAQEKTPGDLINRSKRGLLNV